VVRTVGIELLGAWRALRASQRHPKAVARHKPPLRRCRQSGRREVTPAPGGRVARFAIDAPAQLDMHRAKVALGHREHPAAGRIDRARDVEQALLAARGDLAPVGIGTEGGTPTQHISQRHLHPTLVAATGEPGGDTERGTGRFTLQFVMPIVGMGGGKADALHRTARPPFAGGLVTVALHVDTHRQLTIGQVQGRHTIIALGTAHGKPEVARVAGERGAERALIGVAGRARHAAAELRALRLLRDRRWRKDRARYPQVIGALTRELNVVSHAAVAAVHLHTPKPTTGGRVVAAHHTAM